MNIDTLSRSFTVSTVMQHPLGVNVPQLTTSFCWCDIDKGNLGNLGISRTVSSMMNLFWDYFEAKADKSKAKDFGNVIHRPIQFSK